MLVELVSRQKIENRRQSKFLSVFAVRIAKILYPLFLFTAVDSRLVFRVLEVNRSTLFLIVSSFDSAFSAFPGALRFGFVAREHFPCAVSIRAGDRSGDLSEPGSIPEL